MKRLSIFLLIIFWCSFVYAATPYLGVNYSRLHYSANNLQDDFYPGMGIVKAGLKFNKHFEIEGRYGFGISEAERTYYYAERSIVSVKLNNLAAGYFRGILPVNKKLDVYGMAGYARGNMAIKIKTIESESLTKKVDGPSFGIGAMYNIDQDFGLTLEYINYLSKSDFQLSALELGYIYRF